jgi:hypothetical protein
MEIKRYQSNLQWCELCSKLQNLEDAATVFTQNVHKLTGGDNGRSGILVWVVSRLGKDLTPDEMDRVSSLFQKLQTCGVLTKGACSTERGERKGNLHIQGCFWCPSLNRDSSEVQEAVKCLVYETAEFTGVKRHVYAVVHEPAHEPNVTWRAQLGCVCKSSASCVSLCCS